MNKLWSVVLAAMLAAACVDADAARLGGGRSVGRQSSNVTQREAVRAPLAPARNVAGQSAAVPTVAAQSAGAGTRPWGAAFGGLAAGLGLAWLAHSLGLGAGFGQFLLLALLALLVMGVFGFMRSRRPVAGAPLAFQGAGVAMAAQARAPRQYSPDHVGNDASARPWERAGMTFQPSSGGDPVVIGSALAGSQNWGIPEGFDAAGFLSAAKRNFITLQAAWDGCDIATLRSMMTDNMVDEIRAQLNEREQHRGGEPNQTDVVMLEARLLGIEDLGGDYMASVEFSGMIREEPSAGPSPFREVWNMTKPKNGSSGWLVAGVQALQ
jgi:predicted lipid-binding transport protein (Tim44 family)